MSEQQEQDRGWTEKAFASLTNQQQEPEPSRDATVCAAYWSARQMLDGPVDGFSRDAWHDALGELVDALHRASVVREPIRPDESYLEYLHRTGAVAPSGGEP